ncbi:hypothetical protein ASG32_02855 [Methylobacterium sp. Leaf361]|uniref:hypothetical protein n=1 Tax=Methylobacterium sp. Leaf361 TaxID=1736352 RepID=UPI0006F319A7|nr:hypothetical protein [Methylobacterium sp. Leaf361]KQS81706.1 hypothetical protein ASG32_02855 [Methylobacterium sp. Leaf361]
MSKRPDIWKAELRRREADRLAAEEAAEQAAKGGIERTCASCGVFGASFGFGVFRNRSDGMWSCADPDCRAIVEARVAVPPMPSAPARADPPAADLFGRSAA